MDTIPTKSGKTLQLRLDTPIRNGHAGLFISMGQGTHVRRVLPTYELIVVRTGRLSMFEEDRQFDLHAGQTLVLWPNCKHGGVWPYEADLSFYWIHFTLPSPPPLSPGEITTTNNNAHASTTDPSENHSDPDSHHESLAFSLNQIANPTRADYQRELLHRYLDERERGTLHPAQASLMLLQILLESSRSADNTDASEHTSSLAGRVDAYIASNCHQPLSTSSIAAAMGYNEDYLGRVFRTAYGITITEAVHRSQITLAKSLLQGSKMNVTEIARQCGFSDARYFRRIFIRYEGLTPIAYRRMYSRIHINRY